MQRLRGERRSRRAVVTGLVAGAVAVSGGAIGVVALTGGDPTPPVVRTVKQQVAAPPVVRVTPTAPTPASVPDIRSTVVVASHGVTVYDAPGGHRRLTLPGRTQLGATQTLLEVSAAGDWWQVLLPVRPNGATGWVRKADVQTSTISTRIEIDRAAHRLTFWRDGAVAARYPVAVGTSRTPTPAGRFFINENPVTGNPSGAYGPYALGLSGHSDVLLQLGSGDGVLGIHGTNEPASIGTDASHGCIRLRNTDITALYRATPLGTPVVVT